MKRTFIAASLALVTVSAFAGSAADQAKIHFQAIGSGDIAILARSYSDNAQLHWIGGPLDGTYTGIANIRGLWEKFSKAQGPLKVTIDKLEESANPRAQRSVPMFNSRASIRSRCATCFPTGTASW